MVYALLMNYSNKKTATAVIR